jgi:hypothetical protein
MIGQSKMNEMNERLHDMTPNGMLLDVFFCKLPKKRNLKKRYQYLILIRLSNGKGSLRKIVRVYTSRSIFDDESAMSTASAGK